MDSSRLAERVETAFQKIADTVPRWCASGHVFSRTATDCISSAVPAAENIAFARDIEPRDILDTHERAGHAVRLML
jgi:hypothetical protein